MRTNSSQTAWATSPPPTRAIAAKDGRGTVLHYDLPTQQVKQSHLTLAAYQQSRRLLGRFLPLSLGVAGG